MKKKVTILLILLVLMSSLSVYGATTSDEEVKPKTVIVIYDTIEAVMREHNTDLIAAENNVQLARNAKTMYSNYGSTSAQIDALDQSFNAVADSRADVAAQLYLDPGNQELLARYALLTSQLNSIDAQRKNAALSGDKDRRRMENTVKKAEIGFEIAEHSIIKAAKNIYLSVQKLQMQVTLDKEMAELREKNYKRDKLRRELGLISEQQWNEFQEEFNRSVLRSKSLELQYDALLNTFKNLLGLDSDAQILLLTEIPQPNLEKLSLGNALLDIKKGYQIKMIELDLEDSKKNESEVLDKRGSYSTEYKTAKLELDNLQMSYDKQLISTETKILDSYQNLQNKRVAMELEKQYLESDKSLHETRELQYRLGLISLRDLESARIGLRQKEIQVNNLILEFNEGINNFYALSLGVE